MRILIILLWFFLFWFYWKAQKTGCGDASVNTTIISDQNVEDNTSHNLQSDHSQINQGSQLVFKCDDASPSVGADWNFLKDSILSNLDQNQIIQIEGKYFVNESNSGRDNLGIKRAKSILNLFGEIDTKKFRISSSEKGDSCIEAELDDLIEFKYLRNSKKIVETADMTTIYFEYNSIKKLNDAEVETYLDEVLLRLSQNTEKVKLIGHTDNDGSTGYNYKLGENRAMVIADYLIRKGLHPNRVIVDSRGEMEPIASNETKEGMAKNRRTDLIIYE